MDAVSGGNVLFPNYFGGGLVKIMGTSQLVTRPTRHTLKSPKIV